MPGMGREFWEAGRCFLYIDFYIVRGLTNSIDVFNRFKFRTFSFV